MHKRGQYRMMPLMEIRELSEEQNFHVFGYATTFEPYPYFKIGNVQYYEHFSRDCFDDCDINADVIMQFDHRGRVFARTSNTTLHLSLDDHGLMIDADLGRTELARQLYEDIKTGMITKMSWGFLPKIDPAFDRTTMTFEWQKGAIDKILDVSAVSMPADGDTSISARGYADLDEVIQRALRNAQSGEAADADIRLRMRMRSRK